MSQGAASKTVAREEITACPLPLFMNDTVVNNFPCPEDKESSRHGSGPRKSYFKS